MLLIGVYMGVIGINGLRHGHADVATAAFTYETPVSS